MKHTEFVVKKFGFTLAVIKWRNTLVSVHMSGKLIFTKASWIRNYFSHLMLWIFKRHGLRIYFCRICNVVKRISCLGPRAASAVAQPTYCVYRVSGACEWNDHLRELVTVWTAFRFSYTQDRQCKCNITSSTPQRQNGLLKTCGRGSDLWNCQSFRTTQETESLVACVIRHSHLV
jgi:hypothetical protein